MIWKREILKDEIYYDDGKGGVTFSGGEPLLQIKSLDPLLNNLKDKGINICFETSLSVPPDLLEMAIDYIDELFIDIKLLDNDNAKEVLNLDVEVYFENLKLIDNSNPLNNEYSLKENNVNLILNLIEKYFDYKVEIFKTHNLAKSKYESLNKEFKQFSEISDDLLNEVYDEIKKINSNVEIISL